MPLPETDCDKIGTWFKAFNDAQANKCDRPKWDCLDHSIINYYMEDKNKAPGARQYLLSKYHDQAYVSAAAFLLAFCSVARLGVDGQEGL
jgi:hypothetical protein